ncbi:hypothetical protein QFC19_001177 [Naganishia cerealis]|uniref:Uncharacterized protein n=1 Tax=Naganishia cerealis TaxID=610337 RepID=A0ACC2WJ39_9TREE|nr:hypothetical protein QFC19_001177 [Naganishia cerealis]
MYIRPPNPENQNEPRDDFIISGVVIVHLTKPRKVKALRVKFLAEATLAYPDRPWEADVIFERNLTIDDGKNGVEGVYMEAGPQRFEFSFILPATLAGFDRTPFGHISHRVDVTLEGVPQRSNSRFGGLFGGHSSRSPSRTRSPSPVASGHNSASMSRRSSQDPYHGFSSARPSTSGSSTPAVGYSQSIMSPPISEEPSSVINSFPPEIEAEKLRNVKWLTGNMTASKEMWIVPLPSEDREAIHLDYQTRSVVNGLGIVPWSLQTDAITVGGYILLRMSLTDPNPLATVWAVRLYINQKIALKSPRRPDEPETLFPAAHLLIYDRGKLPNPKDLKERHPHEPLWDGEMVPDGNHTSEAALNTNEVIRMPDENRLRPSTCPGTITPIKVSHEFSLQIYFSIWGEDAAGNPLPKPGPGHLRKAILTQGVLITSCACTKKNLALPTYEDSQIHETFAPRQEIEADKCACGDPLSELADRELARERNETEDPVGALRRAESDFDRGRRRKAEYSPDERYRSDYMP